jgi:hypothetical protein
MKDHVRRIWPLISVILLGTLAAGNGAACLDLGLGGGGGGPPPWRPSYHEVYWGFVTDSEGEPLPGAMIGWWEEDGGSEVRYVPPSINPTDATGRYRLHFELSFAVRAFGLYAYPPEGSGLQENSKEVPHPGPINAPLDSVRVDFVLKP